MTSTLAQSVETRSRWGLASCLLLLAVAPLAACESQSPVSDPTVKVEGVTPSGFLEDYSILRQGGEGEASLVYWNSYASFAGYNKVVVDPVTIWLASGSRLKDVAPAERQQLANEFHSALVEELARDFDVVNEPGPQTLRVRIALTDAVASEPTLDTISTYIPQARLLQTVLTMDSDTAGFVGEASAEGEVRDSETGVLLAAGVDRRAGTKAIGDDTFDSWGDARRAFDAWAEQFSDNLRKRRGP